MADGARGLLAGGPRAADFILRFARGQQPGPLRANLTFWVISVLLIALRPLVPRIPPFCGVPYEARS